MTGDLCHRTTTICECHKAECLATMHFYKKLNDKKALNRIGKFNYNFVNKIITQEEYDYLTKEE